MDDSFFFFLNERLAQVEHKSTVEVFYQDFESIRSLVSLAQPWLSESYFACLFVSGLQKDFQNFVLGFYPNTVIEAYMLASSYEEYVYHYYFPNSEYHLVELKSEFSSEIVEVEEDTIEIFDEGFVYDNVVADNSMLDSTLCNPCVDMVSEVLIKPGDIQHPKTTKSKKSSEGGDGYHQQEDVLLSCPILIGPLTVAAIPEKPFSDSNEVSSAVKECLELHLDQYCRYSLNYPWSFDVVRVLQYFLSVDDILESTKIWEPGLDVMLVSDHVYFAPISSSCILPYPEDTSLARTLWDDHASIARNAKRVETDIQYLSNTSKTTRVTVVDYLSERGYHANLCQYGSIPNHFHGSSNGKSLDLMTIFLTGSRKYLDWVYDYSEKFYYGVMYVWSFDPGITQILFVTKVSVNPRSSYSVLLEWMSKSVCGFANRRYAYEKHKFAGLSVGIKCEISRTLTYLQSQAFTTIPLLQSWKIIHVEDASLTLSCSSTLLHYRPEIAPTPRVVNYVKITWFVIQGINCVTVSEIKDVLRYLISEARPPDMPLTVNRLLDVIRGQSVKYMPDTAYSCGVSFPMNGFQSGYFGKQCMVWSENCDSKGGSLLEIPVLLLFVEYIGCSISSFTKFLLLAGLYTQAQVVPKQATKFCLKKVLQVQLELLDVSVPGFTALLRFIYGHLTLDISTDQQLRFQELSVSLDLQLLPLQMIFTMQILLMCVSSDADEEKMNMSHAVGSDTIKTLFAHYLVYAAGIYSRGNHLGIDHNNLVNELIEQILYCVLFIMNFDLGVIQRFLCEVYGKLMGGCGLPKAFSGGTFFLYSDQRYLVFCGEFSGGKAYKGCGWQYLRIFDPVCASCTLMPVQSTEVPTFLCFFWYAKSPYTSSSTLKNLAAADTVLQFQMCGAQAVALNLSTINVVVKIRQASFIPQKWKVYAEDCSPGCHDHFYITFWRYIFRFSQGIPGTLSSKTQGFTTQMQWVFYLNIIAYMGFWLLVEQKVPRIVLSIFIWNGTLCAWLTISIEWQQCIYRTSTQFQQNLSQWRVIVVVVSACTVISTKYLSDNVLPQLLPDIPSRTAKVSFLLPHSRNLQRIVFAILCYDPGISRRPLLESAVVQFSGYLIAYTSELRSFTKLSRLWLVDYTLQESYLHRSGYVSEFDHIFCWKIPSVGARPELLFVMALRITMSNECCELLHSFLRERFTQFSLHNPYPCHYCCLLVNAEESNASLKTQKRGLQIQGNPSPIMEIPCQSMSKQLASSDYLHFCKAFHKIPQAAMMYMSSGCFSWKCVSHDFT